MTVESRVERSTDYVADLMQQGLDNGLSIPKAAEQARDIILKSGQLEEVFIGLGLEPLIRCWRDRQHAYRNAAIGKAAEFVTIRPDEDAPVSKEDQPAIALAERITPPQSPLPPGEYRSSTLEQHALPVPFSAHIGGKPVLDALYPVRGVWKPLKNFLKSELLLVATDYRRLSRANMDKAKAFEHLAELMENEKLPLSLQLSEMRVRAAFSEVKL